MIALIPTTSPRLIEVCIGMIPRLNGGLVLGETAEVGSRLRQGVKALPDTLVHMEALDMIYPMLHSQGHTLALLHIAAKEGISGQRAIGIVEDTMAGWSGLAYLGAVVAEILSAAYVWMHNTLRYCLGN